MPTVHLAIDLGASSGRAIVGTIKGKKPTLRLEEVHRFEHHPCPTPSGPVWDFTGIWLNVLEGLKQANLWCQKNNHALSTVGVDAWGVDWSVVGQSGELLALPHCYRDPQNVQAMERVLSIVGGRESLYRRNGIQLMPINSLFQVAARHQAEPGVLETADRLMFIPDLFHFLLSGQMTTERTIASTSAMLSLETGTWDHELMTQLGIPTAMLGEITEPGTDIGQLREDVARAAGIEHDVRVVVPATHDTAAAVAAIPCVDSEGSWAYLSSGTWSLLGAEIARPCVSEEACMAPFTHEQGLDGTYRFLKNIGGLWLVQELRRELIEKGEDVSFSELTDQARGADAFRTLIDPNDPRFAVPGDMANKIREYALQSEQPEPETVGDLVRCCLDSLALSYRLTVDQLERVLGQAIETLYVVGGGTQNRLLNEITAYTMQRPVVFGPVEATAIGNVLVQALGMGELSDVQQLRKVVADSFDTERLENDSDDAFADVYERFKSLISVSAASN